MKRDAGASVVLAVGNLNSGFTDTTLVDFSPKFKQQVLASKIPDGGYFGYDPMKGLLVSSLKDGGPSEQFTVLVNLPRAGTYSVEAMWTAATPTEVYVYAKPVAKDCRDANMNMNDADIHYLPSVREGWESANLPKYPDHVGTLLLAKGKTKITFTTRSCNGGRLPSTAWVQFKEL